MSNSDVPLTLAHVLGLDLKHRGTLSGRVLDEALSGGGDAPVPATGTLRSAATTSGLVTVLRINKSARCAILTQPASQAEPSVCKFKKLNRSPATPSETPAKIDGISRVRPIQ